MDVFDALSSPITYPLGIGEVTLIVHDLDAMVRFYERAVGLQLLSRDASEALLGVGSRPLLALRRDLGARQRDASEPGLFHTAFLLPSRHDLGRWLAYAARTGVPLTGAGDHLVSEAIYLDDPEGNGVEVYADRPPEQWSWSDGEVAMANEPVDLAALARAPGLWDGAPAATTVGHVHLQVSDLDQGAAFYGDSIGLDVTCHYPGALFLASGGYHHHVALNIWNSRGAPAPDRPCTGIASFELLAAAPATLAGLAQPGEDLDCDGQIVLERADPWGVEAIIRLASG